MKNVIVHSSKILSEVPSASGMARHHDTLYILSDDSPYLYYGDVETLPLSKLLVQHDHKAHYKIPKPLKTDYESCFIAKYQGKELFFAFGSGSKSPVRDYLLIISLPNHDSIWEIPLTSFYELLRKYTHTDIADFNLEGAVCVGAHCYLFNRMDNRIIRFHLVNFLQQLLEGDAWELVDLELEHVLVTFPSHTDRQPGFSGASNMHEAHQVLFSASVESTDNSYDDGEVLASYVGILDVEHFPKVKIIAFQPITDAITGEPVKEKVEGIEWSGLDLAGHGDAYAVVDNDSDYSKFLHLKLMF